MSVAIANKQQAHLLSNITDASKALTLFGLLRNQKATTGVLTQDHLIERALLLFIILKIHTIFDESKNALSLKKFLENGARLLTTEVERQKRIKEFEKIKKDHKLLIDQIINNRHEGAAHIPKKTRLGVTEQVATRIREWGHMIGDERYKNQKSVTDDKMRLSVGNFPIEETKKMVDKLSKIIFGIIYPRTQGKDT